MKKAIFALFSVCLFTISCKKDKTDPVDPVADKPYTNINNGTNWTYDQKTVDPTTGDTTTVIDTARVTGVDTTIAAGTADQRVYKIISHSAGVNAYLNITGNDYYQFQELAALGTQIQALYLKDNVAVGGNWSQSETVNVTGFPIPITITLSSSVIEKGTSRTINGITYNDVIAVKTDLTVPGLTVTSDIRNYYARNIGLIQGNYLIDVPGVTSINTQTLIKTADPR